VSDQQTFTPEAAALHLQIDYSQFVLQWLPGYAKYLSESAKAAEPILTAVDLALLEQVKEFQAQGYKHRQIRAVLTKFWNPDWQRLFPTLVAAVEAKQKAARNGRRSPGACSIASVPLATAQVGQGEAKASALAQNDLGALKNGS
jgi:hypothetical protein